MHLHGSGTMHVPDGDLECNGVVVLVKRCGDVVASAIPIGVIA